MAPLFLVIAIDGMRLGILFPTLSSMIINPHTHFLANTETTAYREFIFGLVISIFVTAWFFGVGILGDISDMISRKKTLAICLSGATIGYFTSAIGIMLDSTR